MCKVPTPLGERADSTPRTESLQSLLLAGKANKGVGACTPLSKVLAIFCENKLYNRSVLLRLKNVLSFLKI